GPGEHEPGRSPGELGGGGGAGHGAADHVRRLRRLRLRVHEIPPQGTVLRTDRGADGGADPGGVPAPAGSAGPPRPGDLRGLRIGMAAAHRLRDAAGDLHPAQLHVGPAHLGIESAKIDGASHYQTFWRLVAPMSMPAIAAFATLQFLWVWND